MKTSRRTLAATAIALASIFAGATGSSAQAAPMAVPVVPMSAPVYKAKPGKNISVKLTNKKYCSLSGTTVSVKVKTTVAKGTTLCAGRMTAHNYIGTDWGWVYADFTMKKGGKRSIDYHLRLSPKVVVGGATHYTIYVDPWAIGYMVGEELVDSDIASRGWFNNVKNTKLNLFTNFAEVVCDNGSGSCRREGFYIRRLPVSVKFV